MQTGPHTGISTVSHDDVDRMTEAAIEDKIFDLLASRREGSTICPSEVARALLPEGDRWRELMPLIREVAERLARNGRLRVTRRGVPVDATSGGGPIRLGHSG